MENWDSIEVAERTLRVKKKKIWGERRIGKKKEEEIENELACLDPSLLQSTLVAMIHLLCCSTITYSKVRPFLKQRRRSREAAVASSWPFINQRVAKKRGSSSLGLKKRKTKKKGVSNPSLPSATWHKSEFWLSFCSQAKQSKLSFWDSAQLARIDQIYTIHLFDVISLWS